jgi:hypothetical protein
MSEFKGTPGPWDCWSGYNGFDKIEAQVTAEDGDIVVASYNHLIVQGEANAKLISAAPDLLEALKDLKRELVLSDVDLDYIESHFRPWLNKAESAVAKALDYLFCPMTTDAKAGSGWIKCSDRLPDYNQNVLVCFNTVLGTQQITTAELNHQKRCADPASTDHDDIWYVTVGWGHKIKPTHWQPLPAPPTE